MLDPAPADTQRFVELPNVRDDTGQVTTTRVPGCLVNPANDQSICGDMLLDSGAPGITASVPGGADANWPPGTPGRITFGDGKGHPLASMDFTAGPIQFARAYERGRAATETHHHKRRVTPYLAFSVLYDLKNQTISVRPRPPADGAPVGRVP